MTNLHLIDYSVLVHAIARFYRDDENSWVQAFDFNGKLSEAKLSSCGRSLSVASKSVIYFFAFV